MKEHFFIYSYDHSYDKGLLDISVTEEQLPYVGEIKELLEASEEGWTYHVICLDNKVVGFFNLDKLYGQRYEFAEMKDLGFRAFLIDQKFQGKGIGSATMKQLKEYAKNNFPNYESIVLTVNCKNRVAYELYTKYGFNDEGELYHGGMAGPQHVLRMSLI